MLQDHVVMLRAAAPPPPALGPRLPGSYGASKSCAWALVVCCKAGKQTRWKTARRE